MITLDPRTIRVKARRPELVPTQAHPTEWFDVCVAQEYKLKAGDYGTLDLGICVEAPEGYEIILAPRSSTFRKYGILMTNGFGVFDHSYCGDNDWYKMPIYATRDAIIPDGARIGQFKIVPVQPHCNVVVVDQMGNEDRGGLGSTGV